MNSRRSGFGQFSFRMHVIDFSLNSHMRRGFDLQIASVPCRVRILPREAALISRGRVLCPSMRLL